MVFLEYLSIRCRFCSTTKDGTKKYGDKEIIVGRQFTSDKDVTKEEVVKCIGLYILESLNYLPFTKSIRIVEVGDVLLFRQIELDWKNEVTK